MQSSFCFSYFNCKEIKGVGLILCSLFNYNFDLNKGFNKEEYNIIFFIKNTIFFFHPYNSKVTSRKFLV